MGVHWLVNAEAQHYLSPFFFKQTHSFSSGIQVYFHSCFLKPPLASAISHKTHKLNSGGGGHGQAKTDWTAGL